MEKKRSKKSSKNTWKCKEGCSVKSEPCIHLEKLLPRQRRSVRTRPLYDTDLGIPQELFVENATSESALELLLAELPMLPEGRQLLMLKYGEGLSFKQIAKQEGYTTPLAAWRYHNKLIEELRVLLAKREKNGTA